MKFNAKKRKAKTHAGGKAYIPSNEEYLKRLCLTAILFEDTYYVDGKKVHDEIRDRIKRASPDFLGNLIIMCGEEYKLRQMPLFLISETFKQHHKKSNLAFLADIICRVIRRADQMGELLAIYWSGGKKPIPSAMKRGLARCFFKFDEYQLGKYKGNSKKIKLSDVIRLVHPKPKTQFQSELFYRVRYNRLHAPDTWEVRLSQGEKKKKVFNELLAENRLGALALIRNLRNMIDSGVDTKLLHNGLDRIKEGSGIFPYQFLIASQYAFNCHSQLEAAMLRSIRNKNSLKGLTVIMVDVSGSMIYSLARQSTANRLDAAVSLAILATEMCQDVSIYTFSNREVRVPNDVGFGLARAIAKSQTPGMTMLTGSISKVQNSLHSYDRLICITDEQAQSNRLPRALNDRHYMINVAPYKPSVATHEWNIINGYSEKIFDYILEYEKLTDFQRPTCAASPA